MKYKYNYPYTKEEFESFLRYLPMCFEAILDDGRKHWYQNIGCISLRRLDDGKYDFITSDTYSTITIVDPCEGKKPQAFEVDDKVEVLENIKEYATYDVWIKEAKNCIGKKGVIQQVGDDWHGVYYQVYFSDIRDWFIFPHYALKLINSVKQKKQKVTLELTEEQLEKIKEIIKQKQCKQ